MRLRMGGNENEKFAEICPSPLPLQLALATLANKGKERHERRKEHQGE
jgi:hypothetical protein